MALDPSAEQPFKSSAQGKFASFGASSRKRESKGRKEARVDMPLKRRKTEQAAKASSSEEQEG